MTGRILCRPPGYLPGWSATPTYLRHLSGRWGALVHNEIHYDVPGLLEGRIAQNVADWAAGILQHQDRVGLPGTLRRRMIRHGRQELTT